MGRIIVRSEFIKKTQPFICGEGVFKKDAPHCADNPIDIDLGYYNQVGKWHDYIPFYKSDEVEFCQDYTEVYKQSNQLCLDTPQEVQRQLQAVISGEAKKEGAPKGAGAEEKPGGATATESKPAATLTYSQIYAMLAQQPPGVSSDQFRRMQPYLIEKAKRISVGLKELEELRANPNADPAAIEETKVALMREIQQTCLENNPDSLRQLYEECTTTIQNYDTIKTRQKWAGGIFSALTTATIAFIKSGRAAKSLESAKAEWKGAGKQYKWYNPMRWLRTIDAFVRAKEPVYPGYPGYPTPGPGYPSPGPWTPVPVPAGPYQLPLPIGAPETLPQFVTQADQAIGYLVTAAREDGSPQAAAFEAVLSNPYQDYDLLQRFNRLSVLLQNPQTIDLAVSLTSALESRFYDEILPSAVVNLRHASALMASGQTEQAREVIAQLNSLVGTFTTRRTLIEELGRRISAIDGFIRTTLTPDAPQDEATQRIQSVVQFMQEVIQDTINTLAIGQALGVAEAPQNFIAAVGRMTDFNTTTVDALLQSVANLNAYESVRRGVRVEVAGLGQARAVPFELQRDLFQVLFRAANNGIKYSDPAKPERTLHLLVSVDADGSLLFRIRDNGVGMSPSQATKVTSTPGLRLRPDLARGSGRGISGMLEIAGKHGWQVIYSPEPGKGVEVTIKVNIDGWPPAGNAPRTASPPSPGSGSLAPGGASNAMSSVLERRAFGGVTVVDSGSSPASSSEDAADDSMGNGMTPAPLWGIPPYQADPAAGGIGVFILPWTPAPAFAR